MQLRTLPHVTWRAATVHVNGRKVKTIKRPRTTAPVTLTGLPSGKFVLSITATTTDGRTVRVARTYKTCGSAPATHRLSVALAGTGSGRVTTSGINCPGTCSDSYSSGTVVTLTAAPASGSSFTGWSGAGCTGTGRCTVTMSADHSVTATFMTNPPPPSYTLTVTLAGTGAGSVTGSGINCPGACSSSYTSGTSVTLTATPASGSSFGGWSGAGCTGTGTCTVTMSAAQSVTATFTTLPPSSSTLTVEPAGTGAGAVTDNASQIDCPNACSATYPTGSTVVLSAAAAAGSNFTGWSGAGCAGTAFCVVNTDVSHTVTATFTPIPPSVLTVGSWGSGAGSVTSADGGINCPSTCSASYAYATQVTLTANAASGSSFVGWSGGGCSGTGTCVVTVDSAQDVTASFEKSAVASETPGAYSGYTAGSSPYVYFYVAPDGGSIEDFDIPGSAPPCTPSGGSVGTVPVGIASIPINADGSFSSTTTQSGLVNHQPATFTYTLTGQFATPSSVTGTWREDVAYSNNGTSYSCTTGAESFTASLGSGQTGQNTATASPGSYSGYSEQATTPYVYFYVSPDRSSIEDVDLPGAAPSCTPSGGGVGTVPVGIASIPINSDGSFSSTTTQTGLVNHEPATFTYTFTGHFHGPSTSGLARVDGIWREDVTYANNGTSYSCSTNNESFAAQLEGSQTGQNTPTASPGSYSGYSEQATTPYVYFYVSPDRSSIEDVDLPGSAPSCTPSGSISSAPVGIASIPINPDGSFSSTTSQVGLVNHEPATFTYTFTGHFHGLSTSGLARVDGIWREDVTYANNGTSYDCSTNNESFAALLDGSQTGQNTATASPGSYSGYSERTTTPYVNFTVSSGSPTIENVSIPGASLTCTPSGTPSSPVTIASIPIGSDGSFTYNAAQSGTINGRPATITFTFNGHVHGVNTSGDTRIDGIWREDATYANSGTSYYCTSNDESYTAVWSSG